MGENIYRVPSDMSLDIKTLTVGYNNKILVSNGTFSLRKNDNSYTDDIIILLNFIFMGLQGYEITSGVSTNKQRHHLLLLKTGDTCCTNPSLSNA